MYVKTLYFHQLATQPLRDLLSMAGRPVTRAEKRTLASLVRAYQRMRGAFPTKQLGNDLDVLYTKAFSIVNDTVSALAGLASEYGWLVMESKEPSPARTTLQSKRETLNMVFAASHELNPEAAAVLKRCHELLFLAFSGPGRVHRSPNGSHGFRSLRIPPHLRPVPYVLPVRPPQRGISTTNEIRPLPAAIYRRLRSGQPEIGLPPASRNEDIL